MSRLVSSCYCGCAYEAEIPIEGEPDMVGAALYLITRELLVFKDTHASCRVSHTDLARAVVIREVIDAMDATHDMELESGAGWLESRYEAELKGLT